jgi:hypothetical protein
MRHDMCIHTYYLGKVSHACPSGMGGLALACSRTRFHTRGSCCTALLTDGVLRLHAWTRRRKEILSSDRRGTLRWEGGAAGVCMIMYPSGVRACFRPRRRRPWHHVSYYVPGSVDEFQDVGKLASVAVAASPCARAPARRGRPRRSQSPRPRPPPPRRCSRPLRP